MMLQKHITFSNLVAPKGAICTKLTVLIDLVFKLQQQHLGMLHII